MRNKLIINTQKGGLHSGLVRITCKNLIEPTGVYKSAIWLPRCPVIHPYHPLGANDANGRVDAGVPKISIALQIEKLSKDDASMLPSNTLEILNKNGISLDKVDLFVQFQNNPWKNEVLLYRPHPWLHPNVNENQANVNINSSLIYTISRANEKFDQQLSAGSACTHSSNNGVVYSPNNMPMSFIKDYNETHVFFNLCISTKDKRASITLFHVLNDKEQEQLEILCEKVKNKFSNSEFNILKLTKYIASETDIDISRLSKLVAYNTPTLKKDSHEIVDSEIYKLSMLSFENDKKYQDELIIAKNNSLNDKEDKSNDENCSNNESNKTIKFKI